ncbi:MAG: YciI family protein [Cloacibacterium normanense]
MVVCNSGEGAMAIFTDRESAEEFVKGDPFVTTGLVSKVIIKEWHDELM